MKELLNLVNKEIILALSHTLINSIWIAALVTILLFFTLSLINKKYSSIRYLVSYSALLFFLMISLKDFSSHIATKEIDHNKEIRIVEIESLSVPASDPSNAHIYSSVLNEINHFISKNSSTIFMLWFAGMLIMLIKFSIGLNFIRRLKNYREYVPEPDVSRLFREMSNKFNLKRNVRFLQSNLIKTPLTIGIIKPVIIFPISSLSGIPYNQIEAIIAHEMAHIKRFDYLFNLIQIVAETFFFFNPFVWIISRMIREERENVCDDIAIQFCGSSVSLAKALFNLQIYASKENTLAINLFNNKNNLGGRIMRLTKQNQFTKGKIAAAAVLFITSMLIFGFISMNSESKPSSKQNSGNLTFIGIKADSGNTHHAEYSFTKRYRGEKYHWIVKTDSTDNIVSIFRDGEEINNSDFYLYEDMLKDEIEDRKERNKGFNIKFSGFNSEKFEKEMEKLEEELSKIEMKFNNEEFTVKMKKLNEDIRIKIEKDFNKEEFTKQMEKLEKELEDLDSLKFNFNFDDQKFNIRIREHANAMDKLNDLEFDFDFDFDKESLKESLSQLDEGLKNLDIDLSNLDDELKKLDDFLTALREELYKDGYINDKEQEFEMDLNEKNMKINDSNVSQKDFQKYRELYKTHFGKYPDDNFRISK